MKMKNLLRFVLVLSFAFASSAALAQDIQTKGSIGGVVRDANGAALPGAKVTVTGPQVNRDAVTGDDGSFTIENLTPGLYDVVVKQPGFKKASASKIEVNVGKQTSLALKLEAGDVSATVDVSTSVASIDSSSTAVGKNLSDQLFQNIPVQRTV